MKDINAGIYQTLALAKKLQNEFDSLGHKTEDDEILVKIAKALVVYASFLTVLMMPGNIDLATLTRAVEMLGPDFAAHGIALRCHLLLFIPEEEKRVDLIMEGCKTIDMWADVGRKVLRYRELVRGGASAEEIEKLAKESPASIFDS